MTTLRRGTSEGAGRGRRLPLLRLTSAVLAAVVVLTGCAVGAEAPAASPTPAPDLAAEAAVGRRNADRTSAAEASRGQRAGAADPRGDAGVGDRTHGDRAHSGTPTTGAPAPDATAPSTSVHGVRLASADDPAGDHGAAPAYGDLRRVAVDREGESLRMTVTMADVVPGRLTRGEVQGVGLDFYATDGVESDHQVFLDGGAGGWHAYLQTPRGFVPFPGDLRLDGPNLTVTVPWSSLGAPDGASLGVFADWAVPGRAGSDTVDRVRLGG